VKKRKKIGLALGSGGIRGLAHIGVIKKLIEHNIPIDYIAGSSIGAWIAALPHLSFCIFHSGNSRGREDLFSRVGDILRACRLYVFGNSW
jgi:hypothetical protein